TVGHHLAVVGEHVEGVAIGDHGGRQAAAVHLVAADEAAIHRGQHMEVALGIPHHHLAADEGGGRQGAVGQLVVAPQYLAAVGPQGHHFVVVLADEHLVRAGRGLAVAGDVLVPQRPPGAPGHGGGAALVAGDIDHVADHHRGAVDVDDALQLGAALGQGDAVLPQHRAVGGVQGHHLAV